MGGDLALAQSAVVDRDLIQVPREGGVAVVADADEHPLLIGSQAAVAPRAGTRAIDIKGEQRPVPCEHDVVPLTVRQVVWRIDRRVRLVVEVDPDPVAAGELDDVVRSTVAGVTKLDQHHV